MIKIFQNIDLALLFSAIAISVLGIVTIMPIHGDPLILLKQSYFIAFGVFVAVLFANIGYHKLFYNVSLLYFFSVALLFLMLIFAPEFNGSKSWIPIGPLTIQPTEFIKIFFIAFLARYFSILHVEIHNIRHIVITSIYTIVLFYLIVVQPDLGSAIMFFIIWFGILIVSGLSKKNIFLLFLVGVVMCIFAWFAILQEHQRERITTFIDPTENVYDAGYNITQSLVAIGSGGFSGKGVTNGTQSKLGFLPEYENDFIFAAYAEEAGFIGVVILLLLYMFIFVKLLVYAKRANGNFEKLFILGTLTWIFGQMFINIGGNVQLIPVTGITLPFMSYGGSHIIAEYLVLGVIMNMLARNVKKN